MNLGKQIRLNRLFAHPSGRLCSVAVDHFIGYQAGLPDGLRDLPSALRTIVAAGPDAVTMHKGVALRCWPPYAHDVSAARCRRARGCRSPRRSALDVVRVVALDP